MVRHLLKQQSGKVAPVFLFLEKTTSIYRDSREQEDRKVQKEAGWHQESIVSPGTGEEE